MTAPNFAGLTFAAPTVGATAIAALTAGTMIAGIFDPISTQRIFNPVAEGNLVVGGTDAASKWLPVIKSVTPVTVTDYLNTTGVVALGAGQSNTGQIKIVLTPAAANVVEASSVMTFWVSPQAIVLTVTGGTF